ncbi:MAG TPA: DAHL domain-containing protein, partial [Acetobacteraceae bacterium]|nr:DAHL domain-containing protein [Acetobacteraceae bacterium]
MRISSKLALGALLLTALSALLLLGMDPQLSKSQRALVALTDLEIADSDLHEDVLDARAGLLRNYDPINAAIARLYECVRELRAAGVPDAVLTPLNDLVAREDDLSEQFKTDNALLRNSLAYFAIFGNRLQHLAPADAIGPAVTALVTSILNLTLDTSAPSQAAVDDALRELAALPAPGDEAGLVAGLLSHGQVLRHGLQETDQILRFPTRGDEAGLVAELLSHGRVLRHALPEIDQILRSLYEIPLVAYEQAARGSILAHQRKAEAAATVFRVLLYVTSVALAALLIVLGAQLRRYVAMLRRRLAFEGTLAAISMRFVAAEAADLDEEVTGALAELAGWVGASRGYLVAPGTPPRSFLWSRTEARRENEWCSLVAAVAREADAGGTGVVLFPNDRGQLTPAAYESLVRTGIAGWVCVSDGLFAPSSTILGFDTRVDGLHINPCEVTLLASALDTLVKAIERERFERERRELEAQLQQAQRLQSVGALSSGIAHNFNNVVGAIVGYTEMELERRGDTRNLRGIMSAAERARELVDQLMDFGRPREGRTSEIRLSDLLAETASLLKALLPPQTRLSVGAVPEAAIIAANPGDVQQIILNLCNNAAQAVEDGNAADIAITVEVLHNGRARRLSHGVLAAGRFACISVVDSGRGMERATLERLFEPFFTTRENGNGLGLATVQSIVRAHGGAIDVSSCPGAGSRFDIWLPLIGHVAVATPE